MSRARHRSADPRPGATAGAGGARWIFLSAPKLNEPVMQYRSFVMSTADDIAETERLIASGDFGR